MHELFDVLFLRNTINDEQVQKLHAAYHFIYVLWIVTGSLFSCWCLTCCFCWCAPRKLSRTIGVAACVVLVVALVSTFIVTDRIEVTIHRSERVAQKAIKLAEILTADENDSLAGLL